MFDNSSNILPVGVKVNPDSFPKDLTHIVEPIRPAVTDGQSGEGHGQGSGLEYITDNMNGLSAFMQDRSFRRQLKGLKGKGKYNTKEYETWRSEVGRLMRKGGMWSKSERFGMCGDVKTFSCKCGHKESGSHRCGIRICPECAERQSVNLFFQVKRMVQELGQGCGSHYQFRHIVLTTVNDYTRSRREYVREVREGLSRVRRYFRNTFNDFGVLYSYEFGSSHLACHVHILAYCPWIDEGELRKAWGNGYIKVKRCESDRQIGNVVAYALRFYKGNELIITPSQAVECERAMRGFRRLGTWGMFKGKVRVRPVASRFIHKVCPVCSARMVGTIHRGVKVRELVRLLI